MVWRSAQFPRIETLDARHRFLEEPDVSLPVDVRDNSGGGLVGVKSNIRVKGQAWTAGIGARKGDIALEDAAIIATLRAAGADFLSRLNMDEAALGASSWNPSFQITDNPVARGHSAGGSSGGSAAAVAAGACDIALGTDTLGSVRIPAAYCGVLGLKTTQGSLPMSGVFPLAPSLDALGFLASGIAALRKAVLICGLGREDVLERIVVFEETRAKTVTHYAEQALTAAAAALREAGIEVERQAPRVDYASVRADAFVQTEVEAAEALAGTTGLSSGVQKMLDYGVAVPAEKRTRIKSRLSVASKAIRGLVAQRTAILLPTVAAPAFARGELAPAGQADFTALANVAGLPALSVPLPGGDVPASVQLIGPPRSEDALVNLAEVVIAANGVI